jgi:hypothetical protein
MKYLFVISLFSDIIFSHQCGRGRVARELVSIVVLGDTGAGKSTLLNAILGEEVVRAPRPARRRVPPPPQQPPPRLLWCHFLARPARERAAGDGCGYDADAANQRNPRVHGGAAASSPAPSGAQRGSGAMESAARQGDLLLHRILRPKRPPPRPPPKISCGDQRCRRKPHKCLHHEASCRPGPRGAAHANNIT